MRPSKIFNHFYKALFFDQVSAVAYVYKDPFTFIVDIKDVENNTIVGFTFGRLAINPLTGNFVIMVNNVYLNQPNDKLVGQVLSAIRESIGININAEGIIYSNSWNADLTFPGFEKKSLKIIPLVGVMTNHWWLPTKVIYDDFSYVGNTTNRISGYYQDWSFGRNAQLPANNNLKLVRLIKLILQKLAITSSAFLIILISAYWLKLFNFNSSETALGVLECFGVSILIMIYTLIPRHNNYSQFRYLILDYFSKMFVILLFAILIGNILFS